MVSLPMSYFHWKYNQLSSALKCFTVLFGMGRRGSTTLWSAGFERLKNAPTVGSRRFSEW